MGGRMMRWWLASAMLLGPAAAAAEDSPFLPPKERLDGVEARIQQRIDRAVTGLEERITRAVIDALDGKGREGALGKALEDAVARRLAGGGPSLPAGAAGTGLPRLPPLPGGVGADVVPSGATFVGCLDGRAFFQDRSGTPFLVDPRAFPASPGGPSSCVR